mmetsp:Transcript_11361/g.47529  ORF Transcript_11361/g.47529 Transcript_11361/m.47529 type:complete len:443 (+) Transcript_11361:2205-3533(+)
MTRGRRAREVRTGPNPRAARRPDRRRRRAHRARAAPVQRRSRHHVRRRRAPRAGARMGRTRDRPGSVVLLVGIHAHAAPRRRAGGQVRRQGGARGGHTGLVARDDGHAARRGDEPPGAAAHPRGHGHRGGRRAAVHEQPDDALGSQGGAVASGRRVHGGIPERIHGRPARGARHARVGRRIRSFRGVRPLRGALGGGVGVRRDDVPEGFAERVPTRAGVDRGRRERGELDREGRGAKHVRADAVSAPAEQSPGVGVHRGQLRQQLGILHPPGVDAPVLQAGDGFGAREVVVLFRVALGDHGGIRRVRGDARRFAHRERRAGHDGAKVHPGRRFHRTRADAGVADVSDDRERRARGPDRRHRLHRVHAGGFPGQFPGDWPAVRGRAARHGQHRGLVRGDSGHVHDGGDLREHGLVASGVVHHRGRLRVRSGDVAGVQHGREGL